MQETAEGGGMRALIENGVSIDLDDIFIYAVASKEFFNLLDEVSVRLRGMS